MAKEKISGEYGWVVLAVSITAYDLFAIKTKKFETLSTALWKSLPHPIKFPIAPLAWGILTYHLFISKNARDSIKILPNTIFKKDYYSYE